MGKQIALLEKAFKELDIPKKNLEHFCLYLEMLSEWNMHIALISKKEKNVVSNLLAPSLLFFKFFKGNNISVVDIGSGAGFPAIAIKIYEPTLKTTMIEANSKKCAFLTYACAKLNLHCNIINKRIEAMDEIIKCDIITARALKISTLLNKIKRRISGGYLLYLTSKDNHLTIPPEKELVLNNHCAKLYQLKELVD